MKLERNALKALAGAQSFAAKISVITSLRERGLITEKEMSVLLSDPSVTRARGLVSNRTSKAG